MTEPTTHRQVPSFDPHEYRPRQTDYCLCAFVINENGNLHKQLEKTQPFLDIVDMVVAERTIVEVTILTLSVAVMVYAPGGQPAATLM